MRRQYSTAPAGRELEQALADGGDRDFGKEDDREDGDEDDGGGAPLEDVDRGVQHEPDAARADQPQHRRLAHVDVPAQEHDGEEGRLDLRPVALEEDAGPGRADGDHRLDGAARRRHAQREGEHQGHERAERLDHGGEHGREEEAAVRWPHPDQQVGDLGRRVVQELRHDLDLSRRQRHGRRPCQLDRVAREALAEREALPVPGGGLRH
jgi:hypothetical protein